MMAQSAGPAVGVLLVFAMLILPSQSSRGQHDALLKPAVESSRWQGGRWTIVGRVPPNARQSDQHGDHSKDSKLQGLPLAPAYVTVSDAALVG